MIGGPPGLSQFSTASGVGRELWAPSSGGVEGHEVEGAAAVLDLAVDPGPGPYTFCPTTSYMVSSAISQERVDSAPWFSFTPVASRPSQQPPVSNR